MCHVGYEHFYENKSNLIPEIKKDVHFGKMNPIVPAMGGKAIPDWEWNITAIQSGGNGYGTTAWNVTAPGSEYCYWCHFNTPGGDYLDYNTIGTNGFRTNASDRPSCSQASVTTSLGTVTCHATTEITGNSVLPWYPSSAVTGGSAGQPNSNINDAKSHNKTGESQNASCALCHLSTHSLTMPNMSAGLTAGSNINAQCWYCHNISSGYLNITSNTGPSSCTYKHRL